MTIPGTPWRAVQPANDPQAWDVVSVDGNVIAKLPWTYKGDVARVMAAAPDMLLMLESIATYNGNVSDVMRADICAVTAKARGESC